MVLLRSFAARTLLGLAGDEVTNKSFEARVGCRTIRESFRFEIAEGEPVEWLTRWCTDGSFFRQDLDEELYTVRRKAEQVSAFDARG